MHGTVPRSESWATSDWLVLAPRDLSAAFFTFSANVTCTWIAQQDKEFRRAQRSQRNLTSDYFRNERILATWLQNQRIHIERIYCSGDGSLMGVRRCDLDGWRARWNLGASSRFLNTF